MAFKSFSSIGVDTTGLARRCLCVDTCACAGAGFGVGANGDEGAITTGNGVGTGCVAGTKA